MRVAGTDSVEDTILYSKCQSRPVKQQSESEEGSAARHWRTKGYAYSQPVATVTRIGFCESSL